MKKHSLTQGSIFKALFFFSLPMIVSNTISILFHAADVAVLTFYADGPAGRTQAEGLLENQQPP